MANKKAEFQEKVRYAIAAGRVANEEEYRWKYHRQIFDSTGLQVKLSSVRRDNSALAPVTAHLKRRSKVVIPL